VERVFRLFMKVLGPRNYGDESPIVRLWLLRFDVEACRFFHPERYCASWLQGATAITRMLSLDTAATLRALLEHVRSNADPRQDGAFAVECAAQARQLDAHLNAAADELAQQMSRAVGAPASLCEVRRGIEQRQSVALPCTLPRPKTPLAGPLPWQAPATNSSATR